MQNIRNGRNNRICSIFGMGYPIVPVMKQDGRVRVCGDYKLTVNKVSKLDAYPIPNLCSDFLRNYYESTPTKVFTDTTVSTSAKPHHLVHFSE